MFILILIGIAALTGILYAIFPAPEVLWFGGTFFVLWAGDKIRQQVEDNVYLNAAVISILGCLSVIPQIFLAGKISGYLHYLLSSVFISCELVTHRDFLWKYIDKRDYAPIRNNDRISGLEKNRRADVVSNGNWAAVVLLLILYNGAMAALGSLAYVYSPWFLLLPPVGVLLANMIAIFYMQLVGVAPPHGYSCHEDVTNLLLAYRYLGKKILDGILAVILAPFRFIRFICIKIADLFMAVWDGGTITIGIAFWILFGLIGLYDLIGFFGLIEPLEEAMRSIGVYEAKIEGFHLIKWLFDWFGSWPASIFNDLIMALPKLAMAIIALVLDLVLLFLSIILWFLFMISLETAILIVMSIVPILLFGGAVTFLIFYFIDSSRDGYDLFKLIFMILAALALTVVYYLFQSNVIKVF